MNMQVGQQVVCIEPSYDGGLDGWNNRIPLFRSVYTIRGFIIEPTDDGLIGILLEEIVNPELQCEPDGRLGERAFWIADFRPVKHTSIECFTKLLTKVSDYARS